jgi:deoxyribose-phosphate aldolase
VRGDLIRLSKIELARMIDSTLVSATATREDIAKLCKDAIKYRFYSVMVNPTYVAYASRLVDGTSVRVGSTIGFPFGVTLPEVKAFEAKKAVQLGAKELDMVINISALKSKEYEEVKKDIEAVAAVKRFQADVTIKVIIETGYLNDDEKIVACKISREAGADFVKTSVGTVGKATVNDIKLIRKTVGEKMGVKASGGIRTYQDALAMIEAGANRIGTSSAVAIIEQAPE